MDESSNKARGRRYDESPRILVVDDEAEIACLVQDLMMREGMEAEAFTNPASALDAFRKDRFHLAIIDLMMPEMDGFELCAALRAISDVPIIFLSARSDETDQIIGFSLGADDYVAKPFKPRELVARVRARLRRADRPAPTNGSLMEMNDLSIDAHNHRAMLHLEPLPLTPKEFDILKLLVSYGGQPVSTRDIFETIWEEPANASAANTVMVHIRHLRKKLAEIDSSREYVQTVWGVGYRIASGPKAER